MGDKEKIFRCDNCGEECGRVTKCPISFEEVDDNQPILFRQFCQSCCEKFLSQTFCHGECAEDFVIEWQKEVLFLICGDFDLNKFKGFADVYIDGAHTMMISHSTHKVEDVLGKPKHDDFDYPDATYKGKEFFLIKKGEKIRLFSINLVNRMERIFSILEDEHLIENWTYYTNGELLMLGGRTFWGIIAPNIGEENFYREEEKFNEREIYSGLKFFKLRAVNRLDWSLLNDEEFEKLCCDLLSSLERFENVKRTGGIGDLGKDVEATEKIETFYGIERRKWIVQCKHFQARKVNRSDFEDLINLVSSHKADGLFIITSNELNPSAKKILSDINEDDKYPFKTAYWEKSDIEKILEDKQGLIKRYFIKQ